jgi:hypothetical protein
MRAAQQGKTFEQMKQEQLLSKYDDLGKGFIKTDAWLQLLYSEVTQKKADANSYQDHGHRDERPR